MSGNSSSWFPSSWRQKPVAQDVLYPSAPHLDSVVSQLKSLPGLVTSAEIERLRRQLSDVAEGKAFLLQSGDCAELFNYCNPTQIEAKLKLSLLMSLVIIWGARVPVVRIGRTAGQYAKPRSKPTEVVEVNGEKKEVLSFRYVPNFRRDAIQGLAADAVMTSTGETTSTASTSTTAHRTQNDC